jgi:hypothetical protein
MPEDKPFSIVNFVSVVGDVLCMLVFPSLVHSIFNSLFTPWNGQKTIDYIVGQIFAFQIYTTTECVALISAAVCVISATIHLILVATGKKYLAKRYGSIRAISAVIAIVSVVFGLSAIGSSGPWFN